VAGVVLMPSAGRASSAVARARAVGGCVAIVASIACRTASATTQKATTQRAFSVYSVGRATMRRATTRNDGDMDETETTHRRRRRRRTCSAASRSACKVCGWWMASTASESAATACGSAAGSMACRRREQAGRTSRQQQVRNTFLAPIHAHTHTQTDTVGARVPRGRTQGCTGTRRCCVVSCRWRMGQGSIESGRADSVVDAA
jgi:hypothetical protein